MENQSIRKTTPGIRYTLIVASILVLSVGTSLYFFSGKTDLLFSWTINPPLTAAYLGAGYLAAFLLEYLSSRERIWADARVSVPGVWAFTFLTLLVTLIHIDRFHFGSPHLITVAGTWVWLIVYITVPIGLGIFWLHQVRQSGNDPQREYPLPGWLRIMILIQGVVLVSSGVLMLVIPETAIPFWPWKLSALTSRAIGAWGVGNGVFTLQAFIENDWKRLKVFMPSWGTYGLLQLINLLLYNEQVNWGQASAYLYLIFILSIFIVGGYGTWMGRQLKR